MSQTLDSPLSGPPGAAQERAPGADAPADELRQALARFRLELDQVPQDYLSLSGAQRHVAYERLGRAAAEAARIAESAMRSLDQLARATQRDPLTNTPNRTLMLDRIESALVMARRRGSRLAVLFLDLDHFKRINDTQGHACGDEVLCLVARRLESVVRDSDTVSRFGGDEFVVLLAEIAHPEDAGLIAGKFLDVLAEPHALRGLHQGVLASIGISLFPDDGDQVPGLLGTADTAMYWAKKIPGSGYRFHSELPGVGRANTSSVVPDPLRVAENDESMRQSNERLVLTVLGKQPVDTETEAMHGRRVRFLAMVAHELRHPLAPIRTAADLVRRTGDDEPSLAQVQDTIGKQVTHMARLVDDLLDDSRAERGTFRMASGQADLAEVLRRVVERWQPAISLKRQTLGLLLPRHALIVHGDADRLAQVFVNLLDNASKYTPDGGRIHVTARRTGEGAVVRVADNGMGMPADILECVFDLFARGTQAMAVHKGGLGIGLAVTRELVEIHGGTICATSPGEGRGSVFEVSLPTLEVATALARRG
jgi:diguanylate cyclase (GGDEF)-like protein